MARTQSVDLTQSHVTRMASTVDRATDRLFSIADAFAYSEETNALFVDAMREMIAFHRSASPVYDGLCGIRDYSTDSLVSEDDVYRIPHVIVTAFKERKLLSVPEDQIVTRFTSSGTSGQKSQINWDSVSRDRQTFMRKAVVESYGLADYKNECNYLCFSYDPDSAGDRGAAHTFMKYMRFAPSRDVFYAITDEGDGNPGFHLEACVEALERFSDSGLPLRVTGFPAFGYVTLKKLKESGKVFRFPEGSLMFCGGGWKLHTGERVTFDQYACLVNEILGIPRERIRDVFGMVEHGVPYMTCERGNFHVPIYGRVCVVHPGTLEILPDGAVGLLKLLTPYIRSVPAISILSTDMGETRSGCPCGRPGRYIVLRGRAGTAKHKGCAITAAEMINRGSSGP